MILTIRTDKPEAEIGLYDDGRQIAYKKWQAHRELSATIHTVIAELAKLQQKTLEDLSGIIFYEGPGSFTGLRIGAAVTNALSEGGNIPLVQAGGSDWIGEGLSLLKHGKNHVAAPIYGSQILTTKPKK